MDERGIMKTTLSDAS